MSIPVFFDDPIATALYSGYKGYREGLHERQTEEHYKELEKRKKRQKTTAVIGTAIAGAATGGLAAAALAPAAGAVGAGVGSIPAVAGTTAASGAISPLTGALLGANIGAGLGDLVTGGPVESLTKPLGDLTNYAIDRDTNATRFNQAQQLERLRTDENVRQAKQLSTMDEFGLPYDEATATEKARYEALAGAGPQAGAELPTRIPETRRFAFGPGAMGVPRGTMGPPAPESLVDAPGPSPIPGMEKVWGPAQYRALSQLENERMQTIDNPEWVAAHGDEARELQRQALARQYANIRSSTVPAKPKPMIPGPNGQMVPAQLGVNFFNGKDLGDGGLLMEPGGNLQYMQPTKRAEAPKSIPITLPNGNQVTTTPGSVMFQKLDDGTIAAIETDQNGKPTTKFHGKGEGGGVENPYRKAAEQLVPKVDSLDKPVDPAERVITIKKTAYLMEMADKSPATITYDDWEELGQRLGETYGPLDSAPEEVKSAYLQLGQRFIGHYP